ncbi:putative F-box protein At4g09190 [Jatropha curcas]|uniref:putative F-box protein At4g09190 n=1 Tax=Jatropha curcas TaxID=180498 RepID=UPI0018935925|nr:putative F-box protein At4g09190 [Jatropha curcas]
MAPYLPPIIIQEILSRLDVKTLIRFKSVSKSFTNLISSPSFQELHNRRSQRNLLFLFRSTSPYYDEHADATRRFVYQFVSVDNRGMVHSKFIARVDDPIKLVLPSCCGLVCFATNTRIYLCNPATRQLAPLPRYPYQQRTPISGFGFGYAGSVKGYKVVQLVHRVIQPSIAHKIECSVFTIGFGGRVDNGWRVLKEGCPYFVEQFSYPVFIKETINWKINRYHHRVLRRSNDYVVSFNVREEKFFTITHPADWRYIAQNSTQLADLGGMLCMVEISASHIIVWMLRDHQKCGLLSCWRFRHLI